MSLPKYLNCCQCGIAIPFFEIYNALKETLGKLPSKEFTVGASFDVTCGACSKLDEHELCCEDYRI